VSRITYERRKRALDVTFSLVGLVISLPIIFVIAITIKLTEPRDPVIFRQARAGLNGQPFNVYKFRTMRRATPGTEGGSNGVNTTSWTAGVPDNFIYKSSKTSALRTTKIGRVLRRTSLDEIPQLVNVLKGDMSLVGPRPEVFPIVQCYNALQCRRLLVRPGLTGLAQVTGRSEQTHGEKIRADLLYIEQASLRLDMKILLKTWRVAVGARGSY